MKIAVLSDIHGNSIALKAVLADIRARGSVDEYWILGDLAAIGYDPIGTLKQVTALPNVHVVRGNTDRYLVTGEFPPPTFDEVKADPQLLSRFAQVRQSFAWTQGAVTAAGWSEWLAALPLDKRAMLPDGSRVLCVHASPGSDDGRGVCPDSSMSELQSLVAGCNADLVFVGHHHWAMDLNVGDVRLINPGRISNPFPPDLRASYAILHADEERHRIEHRRVDYDHEAVIAELKRVRHPAAEYIIAFLRGQYDQPWNRAQSGNK